MTQTAKTAITLTVLGVVLVAMLAFGAKQALKPLPQSASDDTQCQVTSTKTQIKRSEITVSVYNGSKRKGLADRTMAILEKRKFAPGQLGNAPADASVEYVEVRSTTANSPYAKLVALQFHPEATIVTADDELGPGIDIILGPKFKKLRNKTKAPSTYKLPKPITTCADNAS